MLWYLIKNLYNFTKTRKNIEMHSERVSVKPHENQLKQNHSGYILQGNLNAPKQVFFFTYKWRHRQV